MENYRIFVEKHPRFRVEADSLRRELNTNLNLDIRSLRLLNVYDLFGFSRELLEKSRYSVFGEVVTDSVTDSCDLAGRKYIAVEYLPGQFDQRAASAVDCVRLIDPSAQVRIRSSKLLLFDDAVSDEDLARIRHYYINAVESREKNLDVLTDMEQAEVKPVAVLEGFTKMTDAELEPCCKRYGLAMNADDLREVVKYFRAEGRDPYETELRILDTYWSDHCRHTTFTTELEGITVEESFAKDEIEDSLALYLRIRRELGREHKSICLMDMATIGARYLRTGCLSGGFDYPDIGCAAITQMKAMSAKKRKSRHKAGEEIKSLSDIQTGDLVVHAMYGIGRFSGIKNIETNGVTKDYITIKYAGTDVLYVPVTQLDLVSRYIGPRDDGAVKLNKLNSMEWTKTRNKVKSAVKDMAEELTKLYAQRQMAKGFAFSPDNDWQADFEERFDYQETDDQLRSIQEIKSDMEKPSPMDRLLCGDVGFGKTEVALRAAFKCMLDNKQVAILVPTTVLAWQHYQTAIKRFEHFPVKVELLSRFRKPKEQQQIIRELNRGTIDLIIGTHRLVQKDVKFKDLGLVIIDEEQRFGVAHKEKFKETFKGVDVLTLSATPIPRTLNMAMSGIRDMSVIEEPPMDRHPVQTYVIEHNMGVIAQAISKELRRGGQVYYIHNRVETIMMTANKLQEMLPDARIAFAHGQMPEEELSEIWRQLCDREIDILVCTTIIETGVDVPNVNTLIIEDADRLGLSQLYQLRGRVGRSNRRAFAYFTFRRGKVLTEVAAKRLDAIREFTQFGSGFRIALRDLEIRGAGSILSGKQHGHMEAVGYDMYLRLLNEAIAEQKGEALPPSPEDCLVDISIDAFIPDHYIENLSQRIDCYRKIASIGNEEDSRDVIDELIDRYGDPPKSVLGLVNVALTRNTASKLGIKEITQRGDKVLFFVKTAEVEQIQALYGAYKNRIRFFDGEKPYFQKDDIKVGGYVFEEFYFNLENAMMSKAGSDKKTYHVGDAVPVAGDSFKYPEYFDILSVDDGAAVLIRDGKVEDIQKIKDYRYMGLPVVDERGMALLIKSRADLEKFLTESEEASAEERSELHNKWSRFETYRKVVCTDNFWVI